MNKYQVNAYREGRMTDQLAFDEDRQLAEDTAHKLAEFHGSLGYDFVANVVEESEAGQKCVLSLHADKTAEVVVQGERDEVTNPEVAAKVTRPKRDVFIITINEPWKVTAEEATKIVQELIDQNFPVAFTDVKVEGVAEEIKNG